MRPTTLYLMQTVAEHKTLVSLSFGIAVFSVLAAALSSFQITSEPENSEDEKIASYKLCVSDLLDSDAVKSMSNYMQHGGVTCLDHCIFVSYYSYRLCRFFKLNCRSAARGGLLHDLFLYDWHLPQQGKGLHAFSHPSIALENAAVYALSDMEKDIIKKHMWPLTLHPPRYPESFAVSCVDKYCALLETARFGRQNRERLKALVKKP